MTSLTWARNALLMARMGSRAPQRTPPNVATTVFGALPLLPQGGLSETTRAYVTFGCLCLFFNDLQGSQASITISLAD